MRNFLLVLPLIAPFTAANATTIERTTKACPVAGGQCVILKKNTLVIWAGNVGDSILVRLDDHDGAPIYVVRLAM